MSRCILRGNMATFPPFGWPLKTGSTVFLLVSLQVVLPAGCCRIIRHSPTYQDSWKCNFLGLSTDTPIPDHVMASEIYLLLDIISPDKLKHDSNRVVSRNAGGFEGFGISITSSSVVPDKGD